MKKPEDRIPGRYKRFVRDHKDIADAYESLGKAVHGAGPLDAKTRAMLKVAISGGAMLEGAFHSHIRKAIQQGVSREELEHIAFLALPTIGFPSMMALQSWIDDIYETR